jgi:hypothetical protein
MFNSAPILRHPVIESDRWFFAINPRRTFLMRPYHQGELGFEQLTTLFMDDGEGQLGECNIIVVRRFPFWRKRRVFVCKDPEIGKTDRAIVAFLDSRGINPDTLEEMVP